MIYGAAGHRTSTIVFYGAGTSYHTSIIVLDCTTSVVNCTTKILFDSTAIVVNSTGAAMRVFYSSFIVFYDRPILAYFSFGLIGGNRTAVGNYGTVITCNGTTIGVHSIAFKKMGNRTVCLIVAYCCRQRCTAW